MGFRKNIQILLLLLMAQWSIQAQIEGDLATGPISELDAVQTASGTWITSSMEITPGIGLGYRVVIHRSTDNGSTWAITDSIEMDDIYYAIGDPVMSIDNEGNAYLLIMEYVKNSNFIVHLTLYVSEDEGQNWTIKSQPYINEKLADTPHFLIDSLNTFYISYTEYNNNLISPSFIHFIKSEDGGISWTAPQIFEPIQSIDAVGSNFSLSKGNQINLAYGDYSLPFTYYVSSEDQGVSWDEVIEFSNTIDFAVTKVISNQNHETVCILTHRAHDLESGIHFMHSLDNGQTWEDYSLVADASMAEGYVDDKGLVHITFHQFIGDEFSVNYIYSTDGGITFSAPVILYTELLDLPLPFEILAVAGESQSMILGNDGLFHLTFVDWSDLAKAKHLIFEPFDIVLSNQRPVSKEESQLSISPNPASNFLKVELTDPDRFASWSINTIEGKRLSYGKVFSTPEIMIDINKFQSGTYLLSIQSDDQIIVKRFVKI